MRASKNYLFLLGIIILFSAVLRFWSISIYPPALYTDEAGQGYNAYSLLVTGLDEHGALLPMSLRSFGDWKPPVQTYLSIPFMFFFGLSEETTRLPSILLGILSIAVSYFVARELKLSTKVSLLAAFFLALSPWAIHQSRSAMLVLVAFYFFLLGSLFLLKGTRKKWYILSALFFGISIYSYYGMRLVVPLFLFAYFLLLTKKRHLLKEGFFPFCIAFLIIIFPLFISFTKNPDVVFGRAKTISVFYDKGIGLRIWELSSQDGMNNVFVSRFYHNKVYLYSIDILRRFFSQLDVEFLFINGSTTPPFWIPHMGVMYLLDCIFLIAGFFAFVKKKIDSLLFLLIFLSVGILPGALTFMSPSANRTFNSVFPLTLFVAIGVSYFIFRIGRNKWRYLMISIVVLLYSFQFYSFEINYFKELPLHFANQWAYGYKQLVQYTEKLEHKYDKIVVLPQSNMGYIYLLFYANDPIAKNKDVKRDYLPDQYGYEMVPIIGKYIFMKSGTMVDARKSYPGSVLFVGTQQEMVQENSLQKIYNPDGTTAFVISE